MKPPDNVLPFPVREPEVVRIVEPAQEITGFGWLYRMVELSDGTYQLQQQAHDGTWVPSTSATWADFAQGIAMESICPNWGTGCCD